MFNKGIVFGVFQSCFASVLYQNAAYLLLQLCQEIMAVLIDIKTSDAGSGPPTDMRHMTSQTVFSVLDHLTKWIRHRITEIAGQLLPAGSSSKASSTSNGGY